MSLDTTTSDPTESAASQEKAITDDVEIKTEAVTSNEETSQTSESDDSGSSQEDNSEDTELKEWAAKKNLPLDDPIKLAKMYRESEQLLGKKGAKEGQLKNAVSEANTSAGVDDMSSLRNEVAALSFYLAHPEAKQYEAEMVSILEEKPWIAGDLEAVLDMAKGRASTSLNLVAERQAGGKEALARAEKASRAAAPRASASSTDFDSNKITAANVDALIGKNDLNWFKAHRAEINAALASEY